MRHIVGARARVLCHRVAGGRFALGAIQGAGIARWGTTNLTKASTLVNQAYRIGRTMRRMAITGVSARSVRQSAERRQVSYRLSRTDDMSLPHRWARLPRLALVMSESGSLTAYWTLKVRASASKPVISWGPD